MGGGQAMGCCSEHHVVLTVSGDSHTSSAVMQCFFICTYVGFILFCQAERR